MSRRHPALVIMALVLGASLAAAQAPLELPQPSPNDPARSSSAPEVDRSRSVLYFVDRATTGGAGQIWFARQPLGLVGAHGPRTPLGAVNVGLDRADPAVLPDNQGLVLAIANGNGFDLHLSSGAAGAPETTTWTAPAPLANVNGPVGSNDRGPSLLYNAGNTLVGDLFFSSDRTGQDEIHWAPHQGTPGFGAASWGAPINLGLVQRVPGATAVLDPSVSLLANASVEMIFTARIGGQDQLWKTTNPSSSPFFLGNPAAWTNPVPLGLAAGLGGVHVDQEAALLYGHAPVGATERLFVAGTRTDDFPLLLANDTVAAGENSSFVLIGPPNAAFALVSDLFAIDLDVPPYGRLGVLYPPSPSAFVFDGTGVFPGANYLPLPLVTDATGLYLGNLGPIPAYLIGTTFHTQAFVYDPVLGDWRLSEDGNPFNDSPASTTTITGGGALVQLRSVTLCDANLVDSALGAQPFIEPSRTFHDLDDPWMSFTCRVPGQAAIQARISYDFRDVNGQSLTTAATSPAFTLPGDARDHDQVFAFPTAAFQAACTPGARYTLHAQLEIESAPGVWSSYGFPVAGDFWVTSNRPVVLVHGLGGDEESFGELAELLEEESALRIPVRRFLYSTSTVNALPGLGAFDSKAAELALFMTDTNYVDFTIVAHSIGGLVARRFLTPTFSPPFIAGDRRLVMFGTPNFGARATFLSEPVYTAPATTSVIQAFLPPMAGAISDELTPGSDFLDALGQDWGLVAPSIPVLNFVGHAGIDFGLILAFLGLTIPDGILADAGTNDGLIHVDEAVLPPSANMGGGLPNPINAFIADSHNPALSEVHAIFGAPSVAMARFGRFDYAAGRATLTMLTAFHQAPVAPLAIANPFGAPPSAANTGSLVIPTTFPTTAFDDYQTSAGQVFRNQQSDRLLWTGLPPITTGLGESLAATATIPPGTPYVGAVFAPPGLVRLPETRVTAPIVYPGPGGSLVLSPGAFWPY